MYKILAESPAFHPATHCIICTSPCFLCRLWFFRLGGVNDSYNPIDPENWSLLILYHESWVSYVGLSTVQYSTVGLVATALSTPARTSSLPSVFISELLHRKRISRNVPQVKKKRRQLFMNLLFVSPVEDGVSFFTVLLLWTQTENRRRKSIFTWASGNESVWLHWLAFLPASHSASRFLTSHRGFLLSASLEFCSWCALTLIPPFLKTLFSTCPPPTARPFRPVPGTAVWWQKHVTVSCHDQHLTVPVNDT